MKISSFLIQAPGGGDLFLPCTKNCKCEENGLVTLDRSYDSIPLDCLKLDPLTIEDLQKAAKEVRPSASKQEVENIDYFYKHRKLPPQIVDNKDPKLEPLPSPRPPAHGFGEWLIGLTVLGFVLFLIFLLLKVQGRLPF